MNKVGIILTHLAPESWSTVGAGLMPDQTFHFSLDHLPVSDLSVVETVKCP